jgi:hypothetical protein
MSLALIFTSGARTGLDLASRRVADYRMVPASSWTHSGDIEWYDTLEECKARAERILHDHQVRVH